MHRRRAPPPINANSSNHATRINTIEIVHSFESSANPARPVRPSPLTTHNGMPLDLLDRLRSFPLFLSAPEEFLSAVATHLRLQQHSPRDYVLTEGDTAKAMYWLVRGAVAVTSRDGESTYAELKPGAFFGEIGILMNIPRTATIIARSRCLLVVLTKEALQKELPKFPEVERAIREEAEERLTLLNKKKKEREARPRLGGVKRAADEDQAKKEPMTNGVFAPGGQWASASALGSVAVHIRQLLKELPLFANLPTENLHFLGLSAAPKTFDPFTPIIERDSQGREIFFIVRGEVEVVDASGRVKARLRKGQYFGEVTALSLSEKRTATVRSVSSVETLVISGDVLTELWKKCPPEIRTQLEATARTRMIVAEDDDTMMAEASPTSTPPPTLSITRSHSPIATASTSVVEPFDPDPYAPTDFDPFDPMMRSKSRRGSLAPPQPSSSSAASSPTEEHPSPIGPTTPLQKVMKHASSPPEYATAIKKIRIRSRGEPSRFNVGRFSDDLLVRIFVHLPLPELMRLRAVSTHWSRLLSSSPHLLHTLDLNPYNRILTDSALAVVAPFVGPRPRLIDISNCFHLSDSGFLTLATLCGHNVTTWRMKSVWDVTGAAILEMSARARGLEEIDLSNCRKVSDTLLARIVGWVVPEFHPMHYQHPHNRPQQPVLYPPAGTVIGCPDLRRLTLSYCKHITDRSMSHLAAHAAKRLEHIDFTRCTTITDAGFQSWSMTSFPNLRSLVLADCTYLTDSAIVFLTNAARHLTSLDLSFCCLLRDTATEVVALGCQQLRELKLAFCGSAVSDGSLRAVGLHLLELRVLSVRGCVRVTGVGVEAVVEGCGLLERLDVSQCKNLKPWLDEGGIQKCRLLWGRGVEFETVAGEGRDEIDRREGRLR